MRDYFLHAIFVTTLVVTIDYRLEKRSNRTKFPEWI